MTITIFETDYDCFTEYAFALCHNPNSFWADSADKQSLKSHFSFVATNPRVIIDPKNTTQDIFYTLKKHLIDPKHDENIAQNCNLPPFLGGFLGFFAYDFTIEKQFKILRPSKKVNNLPDFYGGIYDCFLYADHKKKKAGIIHIDHDSSFNLREISDPSNNKAIENLYGLCQSKFQDDNAEKIDLSKIDDRNHFKDHVSKTVDYIKQGDIFQANIARSVTIPKPEKFNPLGLYKTLRSVNAAPFGIYMNGHDFNILSASPERFLQIINNKIIVEPIKGTAQQLENPIDDAQQQEILKNCPKNRAENIMIVDLLRNDITPHAVAGSIKVVSLCELESYKGLHHLVSKITADISPNAHALDVFQSASPGGSITGAPKKRTAEIIYELENQTRSAYCGSAGYISYCGNLDMNILIRTIQIDDKTLSFQSGCGITALSDPELEYDETNVKLSKILETLKTYNKVFDKCL